MAQYYSNVGPKQGAWLHRDARLAGTVGVLEAPDSHLPIEMAMGTGIGPDGVKRWRLIVHGDEVPGFFVVIDREFRPAQWSG